MTKSEFKEQFLKLTKEEKDKLTIGWLMDLVKNNTITISDIIHVINSCYDGLSNIDKFNKLLEYETISASTISRVLEFGYVKSMNVIKLLLENKAVEQVDNRYKIISASNFIKVGEILFKK